MSASSIRPSRLETRWKVLLASQRPCRWLAIFSRLRPRREHRAGRKTRGSANHASRARSLFTQRCAHTPLFGCLRQGYNGEGVPVEREHEREMALAYLHHEGDDTPGHHAGGEQRVAAYVGVDGPALQQPWHYGENHALIIRRDDRQPAVAREAPARDSMARARRSAWRTHSRPGTLVAAHSSLRTHRMP
eukprot:SAG11_NODE_76_length_18005_cov_6.523958_6_plen_190_part_00